MDEKYYDETGKAICQICKKSFDMIADSHLRKHGTSAKEYKQLYPGYPLAGQGFGKIMKYSKSELFKKNDEEVIVKDDDKGEPKGSSEISREEIVKASTPEPVVEKKESFKEIEVSPVITKSTKIPIVELDMNAEPSKDDLLFVDDTGSVAEQKIEIINFIMKYLPRVKNNFRIEKKNLTGHLMFTLITDIAEPYMKIDFEFPKAFWHNFDIPKSNRDRVLKENGWTIIDIDDRNPTIENVKEALKKNNLI